jgi:hypothetical protein
MSARSLVVGVALAALAAGAASAQPQQEVGVPTYEITDTPEDLPEGRGRDETFYACVPCHSVQIVRRQGMTRERWDLTIAEMISRHNMAEVANEDRALILDYLSATFPPRARRGQPNPFLQR